MLNPKLLNEAFPINKVEVFFDAEDHSDFLGFQWEMISQGKIPIGLDVNDSDFNAIGKTGGEKEHILTVEEMPGHIHGNNLPSNNTGSFTMSAYGHYFNDNVFAYSAGGRVMHIPNITVGTTETGGGQPHNNMSPYIVMAFWKRIA